MSFVVFNDLKQKVVFRFVDIRSIVVLCLSIIS